MLPTEGQTIESLLEQAYALPQGHAARLELMESAVRLADSLNDLEAGWETRDELMDEATMSGRPEKTLVAFSWNLAQFDRFGDQYGWDEYDLLWKYKWVLNSLADFPQIADAQIEAAISDFATRLERSGYSPRTVYYLRAKREHKRGDFERADALRALWTAAEDDGMSDCTACEAAFNVDYLATAGRNAEALEAAKPILSGHMRCAEVPHTTLADLLLPMLRLGQLEAAAGAHRRGYKLIRDNPEFLVSSGLHLAFLAYTHNLPEAVKLLERHLPWALETAVPGSRSAFYRAVLVLLRRLRDTGETKLQFRAPPEFVPRPDADGFSLETLEAYFRADLEATARAFDARNGTTAYRDAIEPDAALLERIPFVSLEERSTESTEKKSSKKKA
jgi:hypothetical protein